MKRLVCFAFVALYLSCLVAPAQLREVWRMSLSGINPAIARVIVAEDGALFLVGSNSGATVMLAACIESDGGLRWQRILNLGGNESLTSAVLSAEGNLVVGGGFTVSGSPRRSVAIRFDDQGQVSANYLDYAHSSSGTYIIRLSNGDFVLMTHHSANNRLAANRLGANLSLIRQRFTTLPGQETFRGPLHNLATDDRAFHFAKVRTSVGEEARLFALDDQLVPLYQLPFDPGSLDGSPTGIAAITSTEPAVAWYSDVGTGLNQHLARVNDWGQFAWQQTYFSGTNFLAGYFAIWMSPGGALFGERTDPSLGAVLYGYDPADGRVTYFLQPPKPTEFTNAGYGRHCYDERGAHYAVGSAYNRNTSGQEIDVHFLVLKLDRNLRPVWMQTLYYDEAFAGRTAYHNGHLHIAGSKDSPTGPPPIVKLKILAVRSEGDLSGDGCIDDKDLAMALEAFGTANPSADLNGDGIVDDLDLEEVLHNFGLGCG